MLNVNWEKFQSIILFVTCHGLRNFPLLIHIPLISIHEFLTAYELLLFELELLIKCLNVNWEKIQPIILSVTCHSLRNLHLLIHPFMIHPTPSWPTPPHPFMTHPTPPLHDPPTPSLYDSPHSTSA